MASRYYAHMATAEELAGGFFADCERDGREPNEENATAWLWFTCPARMRGEVGPIIAADARYIRDEERHCQDGDNDGL